MSHILEALAISFSMYSRIPMPQVEWTEKNRRYVICFFPLVGVVIGGAEVLLRFVSAKLSLPEGVTALLLILLPLLLTGGIHADGFLDTADALSSFRSREERLRILKDPHVGAFGIIRFAMYLLVLLAAAWLYTASGAESYGTLALIFVLSRTLSGLSVVWFPCANQEGTLYVFSGEGAKRTVWAVMLLEFSAAAFLLIYTNPLTGGLLLAGNLLFFFYYYQMAKKKFGGITGDLAGWFLCGAELLGAVIGGGTLWIGGIL